MDMKELLRDRRARRRACVGLSPLFVVLIDYSQEVLLVLGGQARPLSVDQTLGGVVRQDHGATGLGGLKTATSRLEWVVSRPGCP